MAKTKKEKNSKETSEVSLKKPKKKKKALKLLIIFVILVGLAGAGWFFRTPVKSFLANATKNVPFLNTLFKVEEQEAPVTYTYDELAKQVETLNRQLQQATALLAEKEETISQLELRNRVLTQYEENQLSFIEEKNNWDTERAKENPNLFLEIYESMYADNRDETFDILKAEETLTQAQNEYAKVVAEMDEAQAAAALTMLVTTDPNLVRSILNNMALEKKALILSEMDATTAATVIKLLSPS
jgi:flagellar motility protein MotE (MotC chaperone)